MSDKLSMERLNALPHPLLGRELGGDWWPIHDICVETGLLRIDVCGKLDIKHIIDFTIIRDGDGGEHDIETFYSDYEQEGEGK